MQILPHTKLFIWLWVGDAKCFYAKKIRDAKNVITGAKNDCAK